MVVLSVVPYIVWCYCIVLYCAVLYCTAVNFLVLYCIVSFHTATRYKPLQLNIITIIKYVKGSSGIRCKINYNVFIIMGMIILKKTYLWTSRHSYRKDCLQKMKSHSRHKRHLNPLSLWSEFTFVCLKYRRLDPANRSSNYPEHYFAHTASVSL